jgi:succinate dehydrogenase / fumarate reductase flavoprotein subunit
MAKIEDLGEVIPTDLLFIGGGIAGLSAAIQAKEAFPKVDILLVDKQTVGWAGKAPKIGGGLWVKMPDDDADKIAEYHVRKIGSYLNDQELLYSFIREAYGAIGKLGEWGVKLAKDAEGKLLTSKHAAGLWSGTGADLDMLFPIRGKARKMGVKILNKVQVVELLRKEDRVTGAVGFGLIDGRFYVFKAKATILANGSQNFRMKRLWASGCGEGIAAAYRAGAEMRNAEFGNFFDVDRKDTDSPGVDYMGLLNAADENISKRYVMELEPDTPISIIMGMEKEVNEEKGPIYIDASQPPLMDPSVAPPKGPFYGYWPLPKVHEFWSRQGSIKLTHPSPRIEVTAALNAELSPIKVDHDMKTTLEGLFAIGDACYQGSAWAGAVPAPPGRMRGSGIMNALFTSLRGGPAAARFASRAASPKVDYNEVKRFKEEIFAPMRRKKGFLPADAIYAVQNVVGKIKYNLRRNKDRLEEAISKVEELQHQENKLFAKDGHGLGKCREAKAMAICAEMSFRAALMRAESRGTHYREDYPKRDDRNWLKWVIVKQEAGKMAVSTEPVPIEKYKFRP